MYQDIIQFEEALLLEEKGEIIIYNPNIITSIYSTVKEWRDNWDKLRKTFRKVPIHKLPSFANFEYLIEYKFIEDGDPIKVNWVYMYGQDVSTKVKLDEANSKGKYVYILTNEAYPGICKIGKAVTPSRRVKQINGAGTVSEWVLRYALPVNDDYKVENLVHKELESLRRSSFQGSSREFFEIKFEEAIKVIEHLGEDFATSQPIYY
jgi:hypothetical protein